MRSNREVEDRSLVLRVLDQVVRYQLGKKWSLDKHMKLKLELIKAINNEEAQGKSQNQTSTEGKTK